MISWMQKHNKYLVWTIWVSTIAFIGAGFVGWGSYDFGSKAGNIAKVGEIGITQEKLNTAYSNLYNQYNQMMQGKLDEAKAKEMGLTQQAFATVATQAKILNFAQENGIIVSDSELADQLKEMKSFQQNGLFSKEIYEQFLKSQRLTPKSFENRLREELTIMKTMDLLHVDALPFEEKIIASAIKISDKIAYKIYVQSDIQVDLNESALKAYWEMSKENYMTPKQYKLSIVWTQSASTEVTQEELQAHYNANSFNYTDAQGKQIAFADANQTVTKDVKILKTKKAAQKDYIAFKKNELNEMEKLTLSLNDPTLSKEIWEEITQRSIGDILKPKTVFDRYATVKIDEIIEPRVMNYEEAKKEITLAYMAQEQQTKMMKLAEETLKNFDETNTSTSDFLSLDKNINLAPLNAEESLQFTQKLFTSDQEKGMISVADKVVVYKVTEQKVLPLEENEKATVKQNADQLKRNIFENNLIKLLDTRYPTEVYMQGLTN